MRDLASKIAAATDLDITSTAPDTKRCIYCDKHKSKNEFSLEHIFPDSMGGNVCSDLFKTRDVCARCNSIMGMFVDGPVIKSWYSKNTESTAYREFVDIQASNSWIPFAYMGVSKNLIFGENEVCEIWCGQHGEHVYHIHLKDDPRFDTYAGGDPIARQKHPGRAYLFLTTEDVAKCGLTIRSFVRQFKKVSRYAGNFDSAGGELEGIYEPIPKDRMEEFEALRAKAAAGETWAMRVGVGIGFEERFMAKLARGIGFKLFGEQYLTTPYGINIRNALWEKDAEVRGKLFKALPLFNENGKALKGRAGYPGVYSVLLWAMPESFVLLLTMPDGNLLSVVISDDPSLWAGPEFDSYRDGAIFLVAPQVETFIGPVSFPDFLAHMLGNTCISDISSLEQKRVASPL